MTPEETEQEFLDRATSYAPQAGTYAIAYAVLRLADSTDSVARAIMALGTADAATPMGAIELLSKEVSRIADAIDSVSVEMSGT